MKNNKKHRIGIVGLGWLGLPLAYKLSEIGFDIWGTTTSEKKYSEWKNSHIKLSLWKEEEKLPEWMDTLNILILNIPPSKTRNYDQLISSFTDSVSSDCHIIFTGSTGIYTSDSGWVNEQGKVMASSPLLAAEKEIKKHSNYTILRLAGLIGENRHPIHFLSGKNIQNSNWPVNLLTLEDAILAIERVISFPAMNQVFNLSNPQHPSKKTYYQNYAEKWGLKPPRFTSGLTDGKIIDSSLFEQTFNFEFSHSI